MSKTINVGDRVVIKNRGGGWNGVTGVVEAIGNSENYAPYHIRYDDPAATPLSGRWESGDWSRRYLKLASSRLLSLMQQVENQDQRITALIREKTAAEVEVEDLKATLHEATEQISRAAASYSHQNGKLYQTQARALHLEVEIERINRERVEETASLYREINEAHAALDYAYAKLLNQRQRNRLAGFRDGYAQRCLDVPTPEH